MSNNRLVTQVVRATCTPIAEVIYLIPSSLFIACIKENIYILIIDVVDGGMQDFDSM